jgi:hypothetical protein
MIVRKTGPSSSGRPPKTTQNSGIKPIVEIQQPGRCIVVSFAPVTSMVGPMKYNVYVNDRSVLNGAFAEEVMRWLGTELLSRDVPVPQQAKRSQMK